jgi:hypothetical protein
MTLRSSGKEQESFSGLDTRKPYGHSGVFRVAATCSQRSNTGGDATWSGVSCFGIFQRLLLAEVLAIVGTLLRTAVTGILELPVLVVRALQLSVLLALRLALLARMKPFEVRIVLALGVAVLRAMLAAVLAGVDVRVVIA